jgi:ribonuclease HI
MQKKKFYVVFRGINTGIYESWEECKQQITSFQGALYKGFLSLEEAQNAYSKGYTNKDINNKIKIVSKPIIKSICVDAACSVEKQIMEYRGLFYANKKVLFHKGPFNGATNNIGEFLAIVHAMAYLKKNNINYPIYSDSITALSWVYKKQTRITINLSDEMQTLINRALNWLNNNNLSQFTLLKWHTKEWGEIPADFGRK